MRFLMTMLALNHFGNLPVLKPAKVVSRCFIDYLFLCGRLCHRTRDAKRTLATLIVRSARKVRCAASSLFTLFRDITGEMILG
jgi:hypothetical protein